MPTEGEFSIFRLHAEKWSIQYLLLFIEIWLGDLHVFSPFVARELA